MMNGLCLRMTSSWRNYGQVGLNHVNVNIAKKRRAESNSGVFNVQKSSAMSRNGGCRGRDESSREKEELDALDRVGYGYVIVLLLIPPI